MNAERINQAWNRLTSCIPMLRSYARRVMQSEDLASDVFQEERDQRPATLGTQLLRLRSTLRQTKRR